MSIFWEAIAELPWVRAESESIAVFAGIESLHIVCIALLGGCVLLGGLAGAGVAPPQISARNLVSGLRWPYRGALVGAAVTGGLLFVTAAQKYLSNPLFAVKLGLLSLALLTYGLLSRDLARAGAERRVRALAISSLVLWLATVTAGRWIGLI